MKRLKISLLTLLFSVVLVPLSMAQDWPDLNHFKAENANTVPITPNEKRVVFMGNSITEGWVNLHPEFFAGKFYINRGIAFYSLGKFRDAIADYSKAIRLKTEDTEVYTYRGDVLATLGKYKKAMVDYDKALSENPCDIHAYAGRALVMSYSTLPE